MEKDFWLDKWEKLEIGFHQSDVNPFLKKHWSKLKGDHKIVFVPLCGASVDMLWLREQGLHVVGVELSEKAILQFMHDHNLDFDTQWRGSFKVFRTDAIELYCGDLFEFSDFNHIDCIYDRASLVALPKDMRAKYADLINNNLAKAEYLLLTFSFDSEVGPPFSVDQNWVESHYQSTFNIEVLDQVKAAGGVHGLESVMNNIFLLRSKK